jgi:hypothetical protein
MALALLADFLPATREEISWWWAESHDHSYNYLRYLSDWPKGRHVAEARVLVEERQRYEAKRAQIRQAYAAVALGKAESEPASPRELQTRRETFFWNKARQANTVESYNDYLHEFPNGAYAAQARNKIKALGQPAPDSNK